MTIYCTSFDSSINAVEQQLTIISRRLRTTRYDAIDEKLRILFHIRALQSSLISYRQLFFSAHSFVVYTTPLNHSVDKKIQILVKKCLSHLSTEQLTLILKRLASKGYCDLIKNIVKEVGAPLPPSQGILGKLRSYLHQKDRNFSTDAIGAAVVEAASQGHEDVVIYLVNKAQRIPSSFLGHAVHSAACKGYRRIIAFLLSEERSISPEDRRLAIINASAGGFVDVLTILLHPQDNSSPLEMDMTIPIQTAAEKGHINATEFLLSISGSISMSFIGNMFMRAVNYGHLSIAQLLLRKYPDLQYHVDSIARQNAISLP